MWEGGSVRTVVFVICLLCTAREVWALRTLVGGRVLELTGHLQIRQVVRADQSTPSELNLQQLRLRVRYALSEAVTFESTLDTMQGGVATEANRAGFFEFDDVFQSVSPSLEFEEAFLDVRLPNVDLRLGVQKFAWGKLDRFQPNDLLNTEKYFDPFMLDEDERKIGVPAISVAYFLPCGAWLPEEGRLTLVWIPRYVPFRFPLVRERWFPPAAMPPDTFLVPGDTFPVPGGGGNPAFPIEVGFDARNAAPPSFRMENSGYAARVSGFVRGVDYALYYYHGFDALPTFQLRAEMLGEVDPDSEYGVDLSAHTDLTPVFRSVDAWGADAAYAWESFTLRAEGAFVAGRGFSRDLRFLVDDPRQLAPQIGEAVAEIVAGSPRVPIDLGPSFVVRDAVEWGIGLDYNLLGYLIMLQVNQTDVLNNRVDLLIEDVETRLVANLRKGFWHDDVEAQLVGLYGIESDYTLLSPRLTYRFWEHFEVRVGYLFIAGRNSSRVGQYKRNDQGFARLRLLF